MKRVNLFRQVMSFKLNGTNFKVCSKRFSASSTEVPTTNLYYFSDIPIKLSDGVELLQEQWKRNPFPFRLFLMMCLNLVVAPAVYASAGQSIERTQAWAIGILALVIVGLAIYLFAVILQPERF